MQALPEGYQPPSNPLDFVDTGQVCHIKVSRDNDSQRFLDAGSVHILTPEQSTPSRDLSDLHNEAFRKIDEFNQDVSAYQDQQGKIAFKKGKIFKNATLRTC